MIATGGGAPAQESNHQFFLTSAKTFHLRVSMENAKGRAQGPGAAIRPLLSRSESAVHELYESRRSIYEELGHPVETDGRTPDEVVEQIIRLLGGSRESPSAGDRSGVWRGAACGAFGACGYALTKAGRSRRDS